MSEVPDIIIIKGAPGSGKSETAKALSKHYPKGARMEVDTLRNMVISVDWKKQQEHIDILQASTKLVMEFLMLEFRPVIVIDTFSGDKIKAYLKAIKESNDQLSILIFGLYVSESELKKRLEKRTGDEFRDFPICKRLNEDTQKWKHEEEVLIDTTGLMPEQTAARIFDVCKAKK